MGGVDHLAVADVDADVAGEAGREFPGVEEDEVAGLEVGDGNVGERRPLRCGGARDADARRRVGGLGEPGAIEADPGRLGAPDVGGADLVERVGDGDGRSLGRGVEPRHDRRSGRRGRSGRS